MLKHILLSKQTELNKSHFDAWLTIWCDIINKNYAGQKAAAAAAAAKSIAGVMSYKIQIDNKTV